MIAAEMVARGDAAARVRAGQTGATVMPASSASGMLPGADRPVLTADDSNPASCGDRAGRRRQRGPALHLLQFAVMGGVCARVLLSIGEDETKGHELPREIAAAGVGQPH